MTAQEQDQIRRATGTGAPLFILSFRNRDELSRMAEKGGWLPIAARRASGAEARFLKSEASVAVIDAREALEEAHSGIREIAQAAETNAAAVLLLVSREDEAALGAFHDEGVTHFLAAPFTEDEFLHALQFAMRHAERVGGTRPVRRADKGGAEARGGASWRWRPGSATVDLSPALARQAGLGAGHGRRVRLIELLRKLDPEGRKAARAAVERLLATREATAFAHHDAGGRTRIAHHMQIGDADGEVVGRTETIAESDAPIQGRDTLTGVRDARAARAWIAEQLGSAAEHQPSLVILLLAVSRFDAINSAFGRATGDAVLQAAARRIERLVDTDARQRFVARLAGAQFAILLAAPTSLAEGRFVAGQLVEALARPFVSGDHVITLGSRVGIVAATPGEDAAGLLRRASAALVEAKSAEGGPIRVVEAGQQSEAERGDRLEVDLRRALDADEIEIVFQPQVSVMTGLIEGAEALARWRHPEFGELGATTLFNVAERSDYLVQLSDHVQNKALAAAAGWPATLAALRLSINITAADIARPGFADQFLNLVDAHGFDRARLTVEVTETGLIEDLNAAAVLLARLREGGLRIAIDDFGTGYSSLAYLKALPLDYLKIDKRLSEDITGSPRDRIVVRSVIDMARSLGLGVIAEGVETQEQLDLLAQEGCTYYQGFLCSPPVETAALESLVASQ